MHPELLNNPTFLRYYEAWQRDPASLVFAPLAEFFCQYKLFADARRVCEAGVKHNPDSVLAHYSLAKTYTFTREWHAARHEAQWLLARVPNHEGAREVLKRIEQAAGAKVPLQLVAPQAFEDGLAGKATEEERLRRTAGVRRRETPTQATPPESHHQRLAPWQTVTMAKIYAQQGHYFKARTIYKTILSRDPQNSEATAGLATLEKRMSDAA